MKVPTLAKQPDISNVTEISDVIRKSEALLWQQFSLVAWINKIEFYVARIKSWEPLDLEWYSLKYLNSLITEFNDIISFVLNYNLTNTLRVFDNQKNWNVIQVIIQNIKFLPYEQRRELILASINSENWNVRKIWVRHIDTLNDKDEISGIIEKLLNDPSQSVRHTAMQKIHLINSRSNKVLAIKNAILESDQRLVRFWIEQMGNLDDDLFVSFLNEFFVTWNQNPFTVILREISLLFDNKIDEQGIKLGIKKLDNFLSTFNFKDMQEARTLFQQLWKLDKSSDIIRFTNKWILMIEQKFGFYESFIDNINQFFDEIWKTDAASQMVDEIETTRKYFSDFVTSTQDIWYKLSTSLFESFSWENITTS